MKFRWNHRYTSRTISNIIVLAAGVLIFLFFWNLGSVMSGLQRLLSILTPFFIGFFIAYILNTPMNFFERIYGRLLEKNKPHKKLKRNLAVITAYLVALAVLVTRQITTIPMMIGLPSLSLIFCFSLLSVIAFKEIFFPDNTAWPAACNAAVPGSVLPCNADAGCAAGFTAVTKGLT